MADNRTRLSVKSGNTTAINGPSQILRSGGGIIFPYTPTISYSQNVNYSQYDLVHTNYAINSYVNSRLGNISITAPFINQTLEEATYTFGVIHFLRVVTKMIFGKQLSDAGTPPPVLEFSSYGDKMFSRIPVLVGSFSTVFPNDVDYVSFDSINLPVTMDIQIELIPQYSAQKQNDFNINNFASGEFYRQGYI